MQAEAPLDAGVTLAPLDEGWQLAVGEPGGEPGEWLPARVPGTAAEALRDGGLLTEAVDLDSRDCWFRTRFGAAPAGDGEEVVLRLEGIATVADVYLNDEQVVQSESMFVARERDVGSLLRSENELLIHCHALAPLLEGSRKPRSRWRTQLAPGNLRFFRTMLLGRCPGFAPGPAPVGPWKPVFLERRRGIVLERLRLRPRLEDGDGVLRMTARLRAIEGALPEELELELAGCRASVPVVDGNVEGEVRVPKVELWWPHTHGEPTLHELTIRAGALELSRRVGFRELEPGPGYDVDETPLALRVNGVDIFARGVVWTPLDFVSLAAAEDELRVALEQLRAAGMNVVRIPGTGAYESETFHDLCDELGVLVWQDFMFANFDYPISDERFRDLVVQEARQLLTAVGGRPSLAVLCGNSEVEQQVAMLGLDPALGRGELFGELLPGLARELEVTVPYVPSAPSGGDLPFRPDCGVANYYGVGGYRRPLEDARRSGVRFAAECLAIANVPDSETLAETGLAGAAVHDPRWKAGVPRDVGAGWDFDDVRDWYLGDLFGVDPVELRRVDHARYLELSRAVSGEMMAETFAEWRRPGSTCAGGLILWSRDLRPGAGWGLIDVLGRPKAAYHRLEQVLSPVAIWTTDEGLGGIDVHVANDRPEVFEGRVRVALYRDQELCIDQATTELSVPAHGAKTLNAETVLGHFGDVSWAYRFGPPSADVVVASLERSNGELVAQAFRFPAGRPTRVESAESLGLAVAVLGQEGSEACVRLSTTRLVYGARVAAPGWTTVDDVVTIEPGRSRDVRLRGHGHALAGAVTALNLAGRLRLQEDALP